MVDPIIKLSTSKRSPIRKKVNNKYVPIKLVEDNIDRLHWGYISSLPEAIYFLKSAS